MNKTLIRIVAFALVPCLLADPVTAGGLSAVMSPARISPPPISLQTTFGQQALEPFLAWVRGPMAWAKVRAWGSQIADRLKMPVRVLVGEADGITGFGLPRLVFQSPLAMRDENARNSGNGKTAPTPIQPWQ